MQLLDPEFNDFLDFLKTHGEDTWTIIYNRHNKNNEFTLLYCLLADKKHTPMAMRDVGFDLLPYTNVCGHGFVEHNGATTYHSTTTNGFSPLVLIRDFENRKPLCIEISEEFRLLFNIYFDMEKKTYSMFDENNDEIDVIKIDNNQEVRIRTSCLKSYIAAKQVNLLLYFLKTRYYDNELTINDKEIRNSNLSYNIDSIDRCFCHLEKGLKFYSSILGKKLIRCGPVETWGIYSFEKKIIYEEFIIAGDLANPKKFTCNPNKLSDKFTKENKPCFLTPVFFKKAVLEKYYNNPSKYIVSDGMISCNNSWILQIDNNINSPYVSVYLGDLGQNLPNLEQKYWSSYNVVPEDLSISKTNQERNFLVKFSPPSDDGLIFKDAFKEFNTTWKNNYGWELFNVLDVRDEHCYTSIRSMLTNEQREFDELVLALVKVTIDSINVKQLKKYLCEELSELSENERKSLRSIDLFEYLLKKLKVLDIKPKIEVLRNIQRLRSQGVAHRKGEDFTKEITKQNIDDKKYNLKFNMFLREFANILIELKENVRNFV